MTPLHTHRQHQAREAYAREQAAKVERCIDAEVERMLSEAHVSRDYRMIADAMVRTWPAFETICQPDEALHAAFTDPNVSAEEFERLANAAHPYSEAAE